MNDILYSSFREIPNNLKTKTSWSKVGYRLQKNAIPCARVWVHIDGARSRLCDLYKKSQVVLKRKSSVKPAVILPINVDNVGRCLYVIKKAAKRRRDAAKRSCESSAHGFEKHHQRAKNKYYKLKKKVLNKALKDGWSVFKGVHIQHHCNICKDHSVYEDNDLVKYLACYSIGKYRFHRPLQDIPPDTDVIMDLGQWMSKAVPFSGNIKIKDAVATLTRYVRG